MSLSIPQLGLNASVGRASGGDPFWGNVVLLMHMDGVNGGTIFTEEKGNTVTRVGASPPVTSTARSQFGGSSALFNTNDTANYLSLGQSADWRLGAGAPFTLEFFVYPDGNQKAGGSRIISAGGGFVGWSGSNAITFVANIYTTSFLFEWWDGSTNQFIATTIPVNQWNYVAICYDGTNMQGWLNGTQFADAVHTVGDRATVPTLLYGRILGDTEGSTNAFLGNIDEVRFTKGVARYSGPTIDVPSSPFPNG